MPNFRNLHKQEMDFQRGYMVAFSAGRSQGVPSEEDFGPKFKENKSKPGPWGIYIQMQGESIPRESNHVKLSNIKDAWGIPQLAIDIDYHENDLKMTQDFMTTAEEMLTLAGCKNINMFDSKQNPGLDIHEMGGARMGKDPKQAILNEWNQVHTCKNVFVTDGAAMTSIGNQNPSLTFMALTARAANYAVDALKRLEL